MCLRVTGRAASHQDALALSRRGTLTDQPRFQPGNHSHDTGEPEADPDPTWLTGCWNRALVSSKSVERQSPRLPKVPAPTLLITGNLRPG